MTIDFRGSSFSFSTSQRDILSVCKGITPLSRAFIVVDPIDLDPHGRETKLPRDRVQPAASSLASAEGTAITPSSAPAFSIDISAEGYATYERAQSKLPQNPAAEAPPPTASALEAAADESRELYEPLGLDIHSGNYITDSGKYTQIIAVNAAEAYIGTSLQKGVRETGQNLFDLQQFARALNSYSAGRGERTRGYDDYLKSIQERFDMLDPDHKDAQLNLMRDMVDKAANGQLIPVDETLDDEIEEAMATVQVTLADSKKKKSTKAYAPAANSDTMAAFQIAQQGARNAEELIASLTGIPSNHQKKNASLSSVVLPDKAASQKSEQNDFRSALHGLNHMGADDSRSSAPDASQGEETSKLDYSITEESWKRITQEYIKERLSTKSNDTQTSHGIQSDASVPSHSEEITPQSK